MDKILIVAMHEFKVNFRRREYIFFTFVLPLILMLLVGAAIWLTQGNNISAALPVSAGQVTGFHDYIQQIMQGFSGQGNFAFIVPSIFAALFSLLIILCSIFLLQGITEEKESRVIEVLLSSVSFTQLFVGKILGLGMLGLVQLLVWIAYAAASFSAVIMPFIAGSLGIASISPLLLVFAFVYFVLGYLLFSAILAAIGALSSNAREASQIGNLFKVFSILPAWAAVFFASAPNSMLAMALSYFPLTAPPTMMARLFLTEVPVAEIFSTIAILVVSIVAVVFVARKLFSFGLLVYGKKPGIAEMIAYLRRA